MLVGLSTRMAPAFLRRGVNGDDIHRANHTTDCSVKLQARALFADVTITLNIVAFCPCF